MQNQAHINNRKMAVALPLFCTPVLAILFTIYGGGTLKIEKSQTGAINTTVPQALMAKAKPIDKLEAYGKEKLQDDQSAPMTSLADYYPESKTENPYPEESQGKIKQLPKSSRSNRQASNPKSAPQTQEKLDELTTKLNSFYKDPKAQKGRQDYYALPHPSADPKDARDAKIEQLRKALQQKRDASKNLDNNPYMQYLDKMTATKNTFAQQQYRTPQAPNQDTLTNKTTQERRGELDVVTHNSNSISTLYPSTSDPKTANSFYGLGNKPKPPETNSNSTIAAVIHDDQTATEGSTIKLRLVQDIILNNTIIPKNTFIYGTTKFAGERLIIEVKSIRNGTAIIPVNLHAYDTDGIAGVRIPGNLDREAANTALAQATNQAGSNLNLNVSQNVTQQLAMTGVNAGINGIKTLTTKKIKQPTATVKSNYIIYLKKGNN
jgi:conjugative transposon TraM protein